MIRKRHGSRIAHGSCLFSVAIGVYECRRCCGHSDLRSFEAVDMLGSIRGPHVSVRCTLSAITSLRFSNHPILLPNHSVLCALMSFDEGSFCCATLLLVDPGPHGVIIARLVADLLH